jgi:hypothetical protein
MYFKMFDKIAEFFPEFLLSIEFLKILGLPSNCRVRDLQLWINIQRFITLPVLEICDSDLVAVFSKYS